MLEMDLHSHLRRALGPAARTYQNLPEPARNLPEPARRNLNLSEPAWEVRKASCPLNMDGTLQGYYYPRQYLQKHPQQYFTYSQQ